MPYTLTSICSVCRREINSREISVEAFAALKVHAIKDAWNMPQDASFYWLYNETTIVHYLPCVDCNIRAEQEN